MTPRRFRKSSYSCDSWNCVEVAGCWRKSSYSSESFNCIEIATGSSVLVRDSKDPDGTVLKFGTEAWIEFIEGLKGGN